MEIQFLKDHNKTALIYGNHKIEYSELLAYISSFGLLLQQASAKKISIFSENRPEWIYPIYAAWTQNITPVIFDITLDDDEIVFILNESKPDLIFCSSSLRTRLKGIENLLQYKPVILVFENIKIIECTVISQVKISNEDDLALIVYTSGTTRQPKGVMLSFGNIYSNIEAAKVFVDNNDSALVLLPLYHIFPLLWSILLPLYAGALCVFSSSYNPAEIMKLLNKHKVTGIIGVPKLYHTIHERIMEKINESYIRRRLFSIAAKLNSSLISRIIFRKVHKQFGGHLRGLICGGAPIDISIEKDFQTLGFDLYTGYGLTEASPMISFNKPGFKKPGSAGKPLSCNTLKIVDGEIVVKGSSIMKGYYNNDTAENGLKEDWLYTGDLGRIDEDGYLYILGRKDEMIVMPNGKKVIPETIETKLMKFSSLIKEAGVLLQNNRLTAVIYSSDSSEGNGKYNQSIIRSSINEQYNNSAAPHKKIMHILFTDYALPRTSMGKLKRYKLAQIADSIINNLKSGNNKADDNESLLLYKKIDQNSLATDNIDIGIDSLDKVVLQSYIETQFGISISQETIHQFCTLKELSEYVRKLKEEQGITNLWKELLRDLNDVQIPSTSIVVDIVYTALKAFFTFYVRLKATGIENIPTSPVIFAANHQCIFDPMFIGISVKKKVFRNNYYFAGSKHFKAKWRKQIAPVSNIIVINDADQKSSIQQLAACLKMNKNVVIFPEGTRSSDGTIDKFKKLFAVLSCELQVPVVPVIIKGSSDFLPKGASFPRPFKRVDIRFLEPIQPGDMDHETLFQLVYSKIKSEYENNSGNSCIPK